MLHCIIKTMLSLLTEKILKNEFIHEKQPNSFLDQCKLIHSKFLNDCRYVFQSVNTEYIAIMTLTNPNAHNENRYTVKNKQFATHRTNGTTIVLIFNKFDPTLQLPTCNAKCNTNDNEIYYYKTIERAFYNDLKQTQYTGEYYDWHVNGTLKVKGFLTNGKLDGECNEYFETSQLCTKAVYLNGKLNGEYCEYHENGKKSLIGNFVSNSTQSDTQVGFSVSWYANGEKMYEGSYDTEGLKHGCWMNWSDNGMRQVFETYKHGKLDGFYVQYNNIGYNRVEIAGIYTSNVFEQYDLNKIELLL